MAVFRAEYVPELEWIAVEPRTVIADKADTKNNNISKNKSTNDVRLGVACVTVTDLNGGAEESDKKCPIKSDLYYFAANVSDRFEYIFNNRDNHHNIINDFQSILYIIKLIEKLIKYNNMYYERIEKRRKQENLELQGLAMFLQNICTDLKIFLD